MPVRHAVLAIQGEGLSKQGAIVPLRIREEVFPLYLFSSASDDFRTR
jgi:hypothetical protein